MILRSRPVIGCTGWKVIGRGSTQSPLTTNGESVSDLKKGMLTTSSSAIIIEKEKEMRLANKSRRLVRPTHPGEMLREDFVPDFQLTASRLASAIGVSRQSVNELLRGRRAVSPEMALRLGKLFGNSPEFWLKAQSAVDLWDAEQLLRDDVASIKTLNIA
jgi:addiction module HigA family antidote